MKPAPFSLLIPDTIDEAVSALAEYGDAARVIAGGQSLMAMMNMRLAEPDYLIDIARINELKRIEVTPEGVSVGAAVTQSALASHAEAMAKVPLIAEALTHVGHVQTRNRGTVCGSLCHADPSAELPLLLCLLEGTVTLRSTQGERTLSAESFQTGMLSTAKRTDEIVVSAFFPAAPKNARTGFHEIARRHGDFAIVALACIVEGRSVRFAVGGVGDTPLAVNWPDLDPASLDEKLNALAWRLGGYDDIHASARYRRELIRRAGATLIRETML
ncbi:FAD binding domain-containing protein [Limibacillus sp. MBR-115]|jgi:2-furoyl-CoA dehydrogenase FAD binding subunit|uniref:FAD binding domain-containing protein n=1 Tax=Limibacillus sp. MBR-115 TaxID=3156465 RepID=UPI00339AF59A